MAKQTNWTPGPWRTHRSVNNGDVYIVPDPYSGTGSIALADTEADARLIAAAPDLLYTLRFVQSDPCFSALGTVTQDEVRAAIARAEGR